MRRGGSTWSWPRGELFGWPRPERGGQDDDRGHVHDEERARAVGSALDDGVTAFWWRASLFDERRPFSLKRKLRRPCRRYASEPVRFRQGSHCL